MTELISGKGVFQFGLGIERASVKFGKPPIEIPMLKKNESIHQVFEPLIIKNLIFSVAV